MKRVFQILIILLISVQIRCSKDCTKKVNQSVIDGVPKGQLTTDINRIATYLTNNNIVAVEDPSGLRYVIHTLGTGHTPCLESGIDVNYVGRTLLTNGTLNPTVFDQSDGVVTFKLNGLILGWQIGFSKFPAGTTATLYIPSGLGYGAKTLAETGIPPNSILVFEVELVSFSLP